VTIPHHGLPNSVFDGNKAITVQSFSELNSKAGNQFEVAQFLPSSDAADLLLITGSDPVIIKSLAFTVDGDGVQYQFFEDADATGDLELVSYNLNKRSTNTAGMAVHESDTVTDEGTAVSPLITVIGAATPGLQSTPTSALPGLERILSPSTTYLLRRKSLTSAQSQRMSFYMTWYEGPLSNTIEIDQ
jgi:hypothetical protein